MLTKAVRKVRVISRKYDGSLRDEYESRLHQETAEAIVLFSVPGTRYLDHRKGAGFEAEDGLIELYFKHKWYNVWHICEQVSGTNLVYINIAMPATFTGEVLEWTDLDLNYRLHLDNSVVRLDEAEFEANVTRLGYPSDLVERARAAGREVEAGLASRAFPFDHERQVALYRKIKRGLGAG